MLTTISRSFESRSIVFLLRPRLRWDPSEVPEEVCAQSWCAVTGSPASCSHMAHPVVQRQGVCAASQHGPWVGVVLFGSSFYKCRTHLTVFPGPSGPHQRTLLGGPLTR